MHITQCCRHNRRVCINSGSDGCCSGGTCIYLGVVSWIIGCQVLHQSIVFYTTRQWYVPANRCLWRHTRCLLVVLWTLAQTCSVASGAEAAGWRSWSVAAADASKPKATSYRDDKARGA